jgi:UDP-3-O-[3-hydroxymyristoyl] N-acetylglucosamine deacetylase
MVLSALMADRSAWRVVEAPAGEPARRIVRGHADIGAAVAVPAYGPEVL